MCLVISLRYHKYRLTPLIANEDILVYKRLNHYGKSKDYYTPVMDAIVKFYRNKAILQDNFGVWNGRVEEGIHSYVEKRFTPGMHYAIIPKGTKFFIGCGGDVVSEKLIIYKKKPLFFKCCNMQEYIAKNNLLA